jgi:hypothetical protein
VTDLDDKIRRRLERKEQEAREELLRARIRFSEVLAEVPGTIPQSDGNLMIQQLGAEVRLLNLQYTAASRRLMDYLVFGVVPEGVDDSAGGG